LRSLDALRCTPINGDLLLIFKGPKTTQQSTAASSRLPSS
jgi:hypothetical protein